jgi:hypothetical protein
MRRLEDLFDRLGRRGRYDDVDDVMDRLEQRLAGGAEVVALHGRDGMGVEPRAKHPLWLVATVSAIAVATVIGAPLLLLWGDGDMEATDTPPVAAGSSVPPSAPIITTTTTTTSETTTTTAPAPLVLGSGWSVAAQSAEGVRWPVAGIDAVPGLGLVLSQDEPGVVVTSTDGIEWREMTVGAGPSVRISGIAASRGRLVASGTRSCPGTDSACPALWTSEDGEAWEPVVKGGLIEGCGDATGWCEAGAGSPSSAPGGRVVVLGTDPVLACGDDCYDVTSVAWTSSDGFTWDRHEIDVGALIPGDWQGRYSAPTAVSYVGGRFVTYTILDDYPGSEIVFLASDDGTEWRVIEPDQAFDPSGVVSVAMGDRGILAVTGASAWTSPDGVEWSRSDLGFALGLPAVFDEGFVVTSTGDSTATRSVWFSPDGTSWSEHPLGAAFPVDSTVAGGEGPYWNQLVGLGSDLVAIGVTGNRDTVWWWSGA